MSLLSKIDEAYGSSTTYPDLVKKLIIAGVHSYTVDVATGITVFRTADGETALHQKTNPPKNIALVFDKEKVKLALKINQSGNSTYSEFMQSIAEAGVRFYEAMFAGENKRVIYVGSGDSYEEKIPI